MSHRRILLNTLSFIPDRESPVGSSACSSPPLIYPIKHLSSIVHHTRPLPLLLCYLLLVSNLLLKSSNSATVCLALLAPKTNAKIHGYFSPVYAAVPSPLFVNSFLLLTNLPTGKTRLDPHQPRPANWPLSSLWLLIKLSVYFNQTVPFSLTLNGMAMWQRFSSNPREGLIWRCLHKMCHQR